MTKDPVRSYRLGLLITATNLTNRKLEVISSIDSKYDNMPIASAVRASAGYPVFFRPIEIEGSPDGGWFVDGGMVSNFPSWVFSSAFRKQLGEYKVYRTLASKPWINIGLRVVEDASIRPDLEEPWEFFNSLRSMVTGKARDQLRRNFSSQCWCVNCYGTTREHYERSNEFSCGS